VRSSPRDLIVVAVVAVAGTIVALLPEIAVVRPLLAIPLVLLLPGYAMTQAMMPGLVARTELALLSVAGSLAFTAVAGVILGLAGVPLTARTWALVLGIVTVLGVAIAAGRRRRAARAGGVEGLSVFDAADRAATESEAPRGVAARAGLLRLRLALWRRLPLFQTSLVFYAIIVAGVALYASPRSIAEQSVAGYTQLWVLPDTGVPGGGVRLGVTNGEAAPVTYRLELRDGDTVVVAWPTIRIDPGQSWQETLDSSVPTNRSLLALLTRPDQPDFERFVILAPPVAGGG
jgi:uncharacterized membrane protein